ncbi:MAG: hypothetical protein RLY31_2045 [Bacteroidota bacterium]
MSAARRVPCIPGRISSGLLSLRRFCRPDKSVPRPRMGWPAGALTNYPLRTRQSPVRCPAAVCGNGCYGALTTQIPLARQKFESDLLVSEQGTTFHLNGTAFIGCQEISKQRLTVLPISLLEIPGACRMALMRRMGCSPPSCPLGRRLPGQAVQLSCRQHSADCLSRSG